MQPVLKRVGVAAGLAVLLTAGLGLGATPASAGATCTPVGTYVGDVKVTLCVAVDTLSPGYPGSGVYGVVHGYIEVCAASGCSLQQPFLLDQTGLAYNTNDGPTVSGGPGIPLPQVCVGSTCSPPNAPGFTVKLFSDGRTATIRVNGYEVPLPDLKTVCVTTTSGGCSGGLPIGIE